MFTVNEVSKKAGIAPNTLRRWIRDGVVPDAKVRRANNYRLFDEGEARAIVAEAKRTIPTVVK